MPRSWRSILESGLGDGRTQILGIFLIIVAVTGTLVMRRYANIETVFVATLLAGSLLGRWWTVLVPLSALVVQQTLAWSVFGGYALSTMTGVTFFVVSGYLFVALVGRRIRPRILFRVKSVALLTTISVPLTVGYDLWTAFGEWYFLTRPFGVTLGVMIEAQVPFTLYHVLSSLIFVPLFGSAFLFLHAYGWPTRSADRTSSEPLSRE